MKYIYLIFRKLYYIFSKYYSLFAFLLYGRKKDFLLLCTPTHGNLGDQAIALAEISFLKNEGFSFFEITAENLDGYYKFYSRYSGTNQKILVHGGGFLGSIWPKEELRFRNIIISFLNKKIIVLPQTITFDFSKKTTEEFFNESYNCYKQHSNIVFFFRDSNSIKFVEKYMNDLNFFYVPDIVLSYKKFNSNNIRNENIIFLKRHDVEKQMSDDDEKMLIHTLKEFYPQSEIKYSDTCLNQPIFPFMRKKMVERKFAEIASYKFVVTDRLHGMIFAYLTDTPCLALNNQNGKVKSVFQWLEKNETIVFCNNINNIEKQIKDFANKSINNSTIDFSPYFKNLKEELRK